MLIFLTCSRCKQKKISNRVFTFLLEFAGSSARGAVAELDEASAKDWILVRESVSV